MISALELSLRRMSTSCDCFFIATYSYRRHVSICELRVFFPSFFCIIKFLYNFSSVPVVSAFIVLVSEPRTHVFHLFKSFNERRITSQVVERETETCPARDFPRFLFTNFEKILRELKDSIDFYFFSKLRELCDRQPSTFIIRIRNYYRILPFFLTLIAFSYCISRTQSLQTNS